MRIPLTRYGLPQVVVFPIVIAAVMVVVTLLPLPYCAVLSVEMFLLVLLVFILAFFRDPRRNCPEDTNLILAPADGTVTEVEMTEEDSLTGGTAVKISIFLSVFNVHINRAPCNVKVEKITYKKGRFENAMKPSSSKVNESNELAMLRLDAPNDKILLRQVSGAIARRIVCKTHPGDTLVSGQKFGMIKFGSRTDLYLSTCQNIRTMVKKGDKVKAGESVLAEYVIDNS